MKKKKEDFFWVSYSDLMTTLFFIMLTLFILTVVYLKVEQNNTLIELDKLKKITNIEEQFAPLREKNSGFEYLEECDKYISTELKGREIFEPERAVILPQYKEKTLKIGKKIQSFIKGMRDKNPELKYIVVLEGNTANRGDKSIPKDLKYGYDLSYERALAVYNLWNENNIKLRMNNVEVLICGSGFNGLCRDSREENNKRFSVQIIPKVKPLND